ncbi:MAG TPA: hypothetical protein VGJ93_00080 [Desulfuromonadaceae bacterium]|jgi:hypothetical protein
MDFILSLLPKIYNPVEYDAFTIIQIFFWFMAAAVSFYFSLGNARLWTSVSVGFFLIFWSQAYMLNPYAQSYNKMVAIHYVIGAISVLVISHGFQEYYVFTRTLEITGSKKLVYFVTAGMIVLGSLIITINPKPNLHVLRNYKIMENSIWFFFSIVNIYTVWKIFKELRDSFLASGILCFTLVFFFIVLWKGSELYLQVYQWDKDWMDIIDFTGEATDAVKFTAQIETAKMVHKYSALLSGITVGGTFGYLFKLMR